MKNQLIDCPWCEIEITEKELQRGCSWCGFSSEAPPLSVGERFANFATACSTFAQITPQRDPDCSTFHVPMIPYSPIDALNRHAAATGTVTSGAAAHGAGFNGKVVEIWYNSHKKYYIAEYHWMGRVVLDRGEFKTCLKSALRYYAQGLKGSAIEIKLRPDDDAAREICWRYENIKEGTDPKAFLTWKHKIAGQSVPDRFRPYKYTPRFDWSIMQQCDSEEEYLKVIEQAGQ